MIGERWGITNLEKAVFSWIIDELSTYRSTIDRLLIDYQLSIVLLVIEC